jgi:phytoene synthase
MEERMGGGQGAIDGEVRDVAMRGEPDRYLAATLAPRDARAGLAALAAFSAELARVPASVTEAMLGEIRLQWWRDALAGGRAGSLSGHPVADAMIETARRYALPAERLEAVIEARELDLAGGMPQDDAGLAAYLRATDGHLFELALRIVGADAETAAELGHLAGWSYGLARGLGRLPMQVHNGGVVLPAERLRAAGVDPAALASSPVPEAVHDAVRRIARDLEAEALAVLVAVRARWAALDRRHRAPLLPLVMVEPYFRAQSGRQLLVEPVEITPLGRVMRIGFAHLTGRL